MEGKPPVINVFSSHGYHKMKLQDKLFRRAHKLLMHQEELGLTEDQVDQIKNLKVDVSKYCIRRDAEIEIAALDIRHKLHDDVIDTEAIDMLIDQKYTLKKDKAKYVVGALGKLKGLLTEDQKTKLESLYREMKKH